MKAIPVLFLSVFLMGCAAVENFLSGMAESDIAIRAGTAEFIANDQDRAQGVIAWVNDSRAALEASEEVKLSRIQTEMDRMIPWHRLTPGQRILVEELTIVVERRISDEIEEGVLSEDATADLYHILDVIQRQAEREYMRHEV